MLITWLRCNGILVSNRIPARHLLIPDIFQYSSPHSPSSSSKGRSFTHPSHPSLPSFIECCARESIWLPWVNVQKTGDIYQKKNKITQNKVFGQGNGLLPKAGLARALQFKFLLLRIATARFLCLLQLAKEDWTISARSRLRHIHSVPPPDLQLQFEAY